MNRYPESNFSADAGDWLMGTIRRNPEGLLLFAAGCALLMRSGGSGAKFSHSTGGAGHPGSAGYQDGRGNGHPSMGRSGSSMGAGIGESVSRAAASASDYASGIKDSVTDAATSYASSVSDYASEAGSTISDQSQRIARQAQSTFEGGMERMLREQPLAVAVLGVAAGAAVAAFFPPTEVENRALGGAKEALADAAGKVGENLMEAAGAAGERLKSAAEEKGLNPEGLKDLARDVASTFAGSVTGKPGEQATLVPDAQGNQIGNQMGAGSSQRTPNKAPGVTSPGGRDRR
jgi:hypothetical protein